MSDAPTDRPDRPDRPDDDPSRARPDDGNEAVPDWEGLLDPESGVNSPAADADAPPPG